MRCPKCGGSKSSVVDSRQAEDGDTIRRRKGMREMPLSLYYLRTSGRKRTLVVVKDGTREQFSRDKSLMVLSLSSKTACFLVTKSKKL